MNYQSKPIQKTLDRALILMHLEQLTGRPAVDWEQWAVDQAMTLPYTAVEILEEKLEEVKRLRQ